MYKKFSSLLLVSFALGIILFSPHLALASTDFTITSPTSAIGAGTPSRAISITVTGGSVGGSTASFALSDGGAGGVFYPSSPVTISANSSSGTVTQFVYIPPVDASGTITIQAVATGGISGTHTISLPIGDATKFAYDTFTGTAGSDLVGHTPDIGAAWVKPVTGGSMSKLLNGTDGSYDVGTGHVYGSWIIPTAPATTEHDVVATYSNINITTTVPSISTFVPNTNSLTGYRLNIYQGNYYFTVYGGSGLSIGPVGSVVNDSTHTLMIAVRTINNLQYVFPLSDGLLINGIGVIQDGSLTSGYPGQIGEIPAGQTPASTDGIISNFMGLNVDWTASIPATSYTFTGPSSGTVNQVSTNFTITPNGIYNGTITPSDNGAGGTFTPTSLTFASSSAAQTFTYTPASIRSATISVSSSPALTDPSSLTFTSLASYWTPLLIDNFNRSDGAIGNGWTDAASISSIVSNQLKVGATVSNPWINALILRPSNENQLNQRMTFNLLPGSSISAMFGSFRTQAPGTEYAIGLTYRGTGFYKIVNGSLTELTAGESTFSNLNQSDTYQFDVSVTGTNPTVLSATTTDLTTDTIIATTNTSDSQSELQTIGQLGLFSSNDAPSGFLYIDNFTSYYPNPGSATSYTFTGPTSASINQASTNFTVTPNGVYNGTITPSDNGAGGTFTPTSLTFASSSVAQTFTYTPSALGSTTISVTSSPSLTNPSSIVVGVSPTPVVITFPNSNVYESPDVWRSSGSAIIAPTAGAYLKFKITGTQNILANVDTALNSAMSADDMPSIKVQVDTAVASGTPYFIQFPANNTSNTQISLASGLDSATTYSVTLYMTGGNLSGHNGWTGTDFQTKINSLQFDGSASLSSQSVNSKSCMFWGDSILEAYYGGTASGPFYSYVDYTKAWPSYVAPMLGCEYGEVGIGGQAWVNNSAGGSYPQFPSTWDYYDSTHQKTFSTPLDYAVIAMGTNDHGYDVSSAVTSTLTAMRAAFGSSTKIIVVTPYNPSFAANSPSNGVTLGFNQYQTNSSGDKNTLLVDLGTSVAQYALSPYSLDNIHPDQAAHVILGGIIGSDIQSELIPITAPILSSISSGTPTQTNTTITWTTDKASNSQLEYGLSSSYSSETLLDTATTTSHSEIISGLTAGTLYHYAVISTDIYGNTSTSTDRTFTTVSAPNQTTPVSSGVGIPSAGGGYESLPILTTPNTTACTGGALFNIYTGAVCTTKSVSTPSIPSPNPSSTIYNFTRSLTLGSHGLDIKALQEYLNTHGFIVSKTGAGSAGNETTTFGSATKAALIKFQKAHGIIPASGYFGPITRAYISTH